MFNPRYQILLTTKSFPKDNAIGLGTQLVSGAALLKQYRELEQP